MKTAIFTLVAVCLTLTSCGTPQPPRAPTCYCATSNAANCRKWCNTTYPPKCVCPSYSNNKRTVTTYKTTVVPAPAPAPAAVPGRRERPEDIEPVQNVIRVDQ